MNEDIFFNSLSKNSDIAFQSIYKEPFNALMSILFYKLYINNKNNIRAGGSPYPYIDIFLSMLYNKNYFNLNDNKLIIDTSLFKIQELKSITNNKCLYDITNIHNNDISLFNLFVKNINPFIS